MIPVAAAAEEDVLAREREEFLLALEADAGELLGDAESEPVRRDLYIDRLLERLAEREQAIQRNDEIAERRAAMIEGWRRQANGPIERECEWLRLAIQGAADGYDFGKKKSRALPHGTFGFRSTRESIAIVDMDEAVSFAEANELEVKKSVNKTPLLAYVKENGIIPDGCELVPARDEFYCKVEG